MPVRIVFRCEFCDARPDADTQLSLEHQLKAELFGEYLDAPPSNWLTWTGRGLFGPARYACAEHRGDLTAYLRTHYSSVGPHPWKKGPYLRHPPPRSRPDSSLTRAVTPRSGKSY
ncbi:MAG: hypothetical protein H0U42_02530 [Thermoleophilaceae bacterium]|nr:hypothetical protein [Thermoleophilaceae bacterium]